MTKVVPFLCNEIVHSESPVYASVVPLAVPVVETFYAGSQFAPYHHTMAPDQLADSVSMPFPLWSSGVQCLPEDSCCTCIQELKNNRVLRAPDTKMWLTAERHGNSQV